MRRSNNDGAATLGSDERHLARLAPCTRDYFKALVDAGRCAKGVCLPATLLPIPSWKYQAELVGEFGTGTNGVGWILVDLQQFATSAAASVWYTSATYTGTVATGLAKSGTGITAAVCNSPNASAISITNTVRLVAMSITVEPTTPGLNRGGSLTGWVEPSHQDLAAGGATVASIIAAPASTFMGYGVNAVRFLHNAGPPVTPVELEFQDTIVAKAALVVAVVSTSAQTLHYHVSAHYEAVQTAGAFVRTVSHVDPAGAGAVTAAVNNAIQTNSRDPHNSRPWYVRALRMVGDAVSMVLPTAGPIIRAAAPVVGTVVRGLVANRAGPRPVQQQAQRRRIAQNAQSSTNRRLQRALPESRSGRRQ